MQYWNFGNLMENSPVSKSALTLGCEVIFCPSAIPDVLAAMAPVAE